MKMDVYINGGSSKCGQKVENDNESIVKLFILKIRFDRSRTERSRTVELFYIEVYFWP